MKDLTLQWKLLPSILSSVEFYHHILGKKYTLAVDKIDNLDIFYSCEKIQFIYTDSTTFLSGIDRISHTVGRYPQSPIITD